MICVWEYIEGGVRCINCGTLRDKKRARNCSVDKVQSEQQECPHFLGATEELVLVFGCGCPSQQAEGVQITVCECALELHPRCTLFDRGELQDKTIVRCSTCQDNPNK